MTRRSLEDIEAHADELADAFESYEPDRLLRSFALRYASFPRTVKGEGAQQRERGVADASAGLFSRAAAPAPDVQARPRALGTAAPTAQAL